RCIDRVDRTVDEDEIRRGHRAACRGVERESPSEEAQFHAENPWREVGYRARFYASIDSACINASEDSARTPRARFPQFMGEASMKHPAAIAVIVFLSSALGARPLSSAPTAYQPIDNSMAGKVVTLTGSDLTIDELIQVARHGAKVEVSPQARQREADNYGLLLEAAAEGISVYWFNRGAGDQRETVMFSGDPL